MNPRDTGARGGDPAGDVAVIGMACRFPHADTPDTFWANLRAGRDSIARFTREELAAEGVPPDVLASPGYVPARGYLAGADLFDADLFEYSPAEAALIDPQHRILLECALEALEAAGWGAQEGERVGVYVGTSLSTYVLSLIANPRTRGQVDPVTLITSERDCAATRIAYKLNLTGPAMTVQTACSTSLTAVHAAASALLRGECDTALAGGASVSVPGKSGYRHDEGGAFSPDGRTRSFDAAAAGTVPGDGSGLVVLRRLSDAVAEGDPIRAVIKGSGIGNDGREKVGFTAPSIEGQYRAIRDAQRAAGVTADSIGYVETHGTATRLGDPIEIAALSRAFRASPRPRVRPCALGAVKSNIGHLDAAAGVAGLIKTVLALENRELPPTLHFREPNPLLNLDETPFFVNDRLRSWQAEDGPRRAGVSAFGVGGTNVHVIVEEYPRADERPVTQNPGIEHIVVISGRTREACASGRRRLGAALRAGLGSARVEDLAHTAAAGRRHREHRWFAVTSTTADLADALDVPRASSATADGGPPRARSGRVPGPRPRTVFVFPGAGVQYQGIARGLYDSEPVFRAAVDRCAHALAGQDGVDLRAVLYGSHDDTRLRHPPRALPALFAVEYGLARLLDDWAVRPDVMVGHSMGEYTAACLAGVMSVEDAVMLVRRRGELSVQAETGTMLLVALPEAEIAPLLGDGVTIAAVNAPDTCVVSGRREAVARLAERLEEMGAECRTVPVNAPGHSPLLDPIMPLFREAFGRIRLSPPRVPFASNVTGEWVTPEQATDPDYWVRHFRSTVRFSEGLARALEQPAVVWILGPGRSYAGWARRHTGGDRRQVVLSCLPEPARAHQDRRELLDALGRHWLAGGEVAWPAVFGSHRPCRTAFPAYPFQRRRYWVRGLAGQWMSAAGDGQDQRPEARPDQAPGDADDADDALPDVAADALLDAHSRPDLDVEYVAPRTELERRLAACWSELLGVDGLGVQDDFFELGGDSLLAVRLARLIRSRHEMTVPAGAITRRRTIGALAAALDQGEIGGGPGGHLDLQPDLQPDLTAHADAATRRVRDAIGGRRLTRSSPARPVLLLTGATGNLGPYLLRELLTAQPHPVAVLVRANRDEEALGRLRAVLTQRSLWDPAFANRITVLRGDLGAPGLGWTPQMWEELTGSVTAIYHCGAEVNFVRPYDRLAAANVHGTEELVRLAARSGAHLHHVSTLGVLYDEGLDPGKTLPEQPLGRQPGLLPTGYVQSKWVAEHVVEQAAEHGVPAAIYRLGGISGDSQTGYANPEDLFWRIVLTSLATGHAPRRGGYLTSAPVDWIARALVALTLRSPTGVLHLTAPDQPWDRVWEWTRELGHPVTSIPYDDWLTDVANRVDAGEPLALAPVVSMLPRLLPRDGTPRFDTGRAGQLLSAAGADLPALDRPAFANCLRFLMSTTSSTGSRPRAPATP